MTDELTTSPLDLHLAALLQRLNGAPDAALELATRTVSAWRAAGHICVPLAAIGPTVTAAKLRATRVVGAPGDFKPLILDPQGRLYLQRYWQYEHDLATALRARIGIRAACDEALLQEGLKRFFTGHAEPDWQRVAAETALRNCFCVISGGPGTGKTRTVVAVLALLHEQFVAPRIALAAPTGKAAARMKESIQQVVEHEPAFAGLRGSRAAEATTLHRLLGVIPNSPYFRHDAKRPLAVDAVIVDEASMVDLALMAKLVAAVPPEARLILLGDKDQLASVEAGSVLGDICSASSTASAAPIVQYVVVLRKNYRFAEGSGIQALSTAVNSGDAQTALRLLESGNSPDLVFTPTPAPKELPEAIRPHVVTGYRAYLTAPDSTEALRRLGDFRILATTRRGPFGVQNLNRLAEEALTDEGLIEPTGIHYHGRPVLIRANDYPLRLFNGDVGLILRDENASGQLRAFFLDAEGRLRCVLPARLPEHETSFATTIHKSQGSEFPRLLLVLPDRDGPLMTRELIYTGVTRARRQVHLWARPDLLRAAIARRTERTSGLRDALWR